MDRSKSYSADPLENAPAVHKIRGVDLIPYMNTSRNQVLLRALEISGGRHQLARKLRAREAELNSWLAGDTDVPDAVFLKAVDIVFSETPHRGASEDGGPVPRH
jgi:hypothetical protein